VYRASVPRTLVLVVALFSTVAATGAIARESRFSDTESEGDPTIRALRGLSRVLGRLIAKWTGGWHRIRISHSHMPGEEKESIEQTRVGAIDINRNDVALIGNFMPSMNVLAMSFLFRSIESPQNVLDRPTVKAWQGADRAQWQRGVTST
jgi:TRAP-type C4-dicarboxylate transport system substrate-binding protein